MKIYVVTGSWSDYGDSSHWMVRGFSESSVARSFYADCQSIADRLCSEYQVIYDEYVRAQEGVRQWESKKFGDEFTAEWKALSELYGNKLDALKSELDPEFHPEYGDGTNYNVEELEVD